MFDATGDGILILDPESGKVIASNVRAAGFAGFSDSANGTAANHAFTQPWLCDRQGKTLSPGEHPVNRSLRGEAFSNYRVTFRSEGGAPREYVTAGGSIDTPNGRRAYVIVRDLTDIRRLERVKEEIMQVMVHECRNPLQIMKGAALMLSLTLQKGETERAQGFVDSISRQIDAVSTVLTDLTSAIEVTSTRQHPPEGTVNFSTLCHQAIAEFRSVKRPEHVWHIDIPASDGLVVCGDESRLNVILGNLLSNADKYTPPHKQIWLSCSRDGGHITTRVADEGVGIPAGDLERIFDGFYRSPNFADWGLGGTFSLGLYISRNIARQHGGDLWAEHRDGGGTVMVLRLPLAHGAVANS